jgi:hypothetical protein
MADMVVTVSPPLTEAGLVRPDKSDNDHLQVEKDSQVEVGTPTTSGRMSFRAIHTLQVDRTSLMNLPVRRGDATQCSIAGIALL